MHRGLSKTVFIIGVIGMSMIINPTSLLCQKPNPTILFYAMYVFEASTNGDTVAFPLLPGETAVSTLESFSENAQDYIDNLRSIYSFHHFSLLTTFGGAVSHGLEKGDGSLRTFIRIEGERKAYLYLGVSFDDESQHRLLQIRLEAQLDTISGRASFIPDPKQPYLFKMLSAVKHGQPLVIGRPWHVNDGRKHALFFVFTPFFQRLDRSDQYDDVIALYRSVLKSLPSKQGVAGEPFFHRLNQYFSDVLHRKDVLPVEQILPPPPPPPAPPDTDVPVFVPFDSAPEPVDGYGAIQKNLVYPEEARKAGVEGRVMVWVNIDARGEVKRMQLMRSLGHSGCDEAAMNAIKSVTWKPAMDEDKAVPVWVAVPVNFRLK
jgi:TonB family protein